jgi:hypothetical protein
MEGDRIAASFTQLEPEPFRLLGSAKYLANIWQSFRVMHNIAEYCTAA